MPGQRYRVTAHYHLYPPGDGQAFLGLKEPEGPYFWAGDSHPRRVGHALPGIDRFLRPAADHSSGKQRQPAKYECLF